MRRVRSLASAAILLSFFGRVSAAGFEWSSLAPLPDREGFAGMYAGVAGSVLLAAGGTQFANGIPSWEGGTKIWSDTIFVLEARDKTWRVAPQRLPRLLGDGVAIGRNDEVICIGGGDAAKGYADVFTLRWSVGRVEIGSLPSLPAPCLKMSGVILGDVIYIAGGRDDPNSPTTLRTFWALDLSRAKAERRWQILPVWPGPSRMMPIMAVAKGALFLFGGIEVVPDAQGRPTNKTPYLDDAFRYTPGHSGGDGKWERLAKLKRPLAAAPSPAFVADDDAISIFGGIDGALEAIPVAKRGSIRALPGDMVTYSIAKDIWTHSGEMPPAAVRVNAPAFLWGDRYVIVGGERLPARRTNACTIVEFARSREN